MRPASARPGAAASACAGGRRRFGTGWLVALAGGGAAAIAHPPFGVWPGVFGFALVLHALDRAGAARRPLIAAFLRGWAAGFAYLLIGTWWIGEAFLVDIAAHGWQAPFAVLLTPLGIGLFWGAAGLVYRLIAPPNGLRILVFAAVLSIFEWLRGHVLTGFPWDLPGEAWRAGSAPSQAAALVGVYGLSFVTIAIGASPVVLLGRARLRTRIATLLIAGAALAALWGWGAWRLSRAHEPNLPLRLRIVQPNLPEPSGWSEALVRSTVARYAALTALPSAHPPSIVVWPEGAVPDSFNDYLAPGSLTAQMVAGALRPGQILLAGGYRLQGDPSRPLAYNTLLAVRRLPGGLAVLGHYDKHHLVPFGEYMPLKRWLEPLGLRKLISVPVDFTPGPKPAPLHLDGVPPVQPLICYESLFPGYVPSGPSRPTWILNVSDDAWFGRTSGPWQHLNLASYRAIEEGLPLIRATPTGVSAVVDGYGRLRADLPLGRSGVIDADLPAPLAPTTFSCWRRWPFLFFCLLGLACAVRLSDERRKSTSQAEP